jgi:hypothetical protein
MSTWSIANLRRFLGELHIWLANLPIVGRLYCGIFLLVVIFGGLWLWLSFWAAIGWACSYGLADLAEYLERMM